jgi:hypothetical protein
LAEASHVLLAAMSFRAVSGRRPISHVTAPNMPATWGHQP